MPSNAALQRRRRSTGGGGTPPVALTAEYLVVAGGGGGAVLHSGGGGAGGYRSSVTGESSGGGASAESALSIALGTPYTITVGAGGAGVPASYASDANKGNSSVFDTITSEGGGGGSIDGLEPPGTIDGGSGGGGGAGPTAPGGSGTAGQGYAGGNGSNAGGSTYHGGGGGGAAEVGGNSTTGVKAGDGGDGVQSYITGSAVYRAGGGGGSSYVTSQAGGTGGLGGGGNGGNGVSGASGTANTGGGGGAGGGPSGASGAGGSGVVIIKVPGTVVAEFSAGVAYNYIPLDDFNVYEITAAGASDTVTFSEGAVTTIGESLRFNDDDSAYLYRTASTGNLRTYTFSAWAKFTGAGPGWLFAAGGSSAPLRWGLYRKSNGQIVTDIYGTGEYNSSLSLFRDPSAWYHIVWTVDTTAPTAIDRSVIYINGKRIDDANTRTLPLNFDTTINRAIAHYIGTSAPNPFLLDGYLSDVYFIDGAAHDPSRFGKQDADGIWQPITYTGSYGTNGFHLEFADTSTAQSLGTDTSGNGNDWTLSGITTADQFADTPSLNYCTMNPLDTGAAHTLSDGNLRVSQVGTNWDTTRSTFALTSGKWYWEIGDILSANYIMVGLSKSTQDLSIYPGQDANGYGYYSVGGNLYNNGSTPYGASYGVADTVGVSFDADIGELIFYKNGVSQGVAATGLTNDLWFPSIGVHTSAASFNFGQKPFAYTPPAGFQALSSANLPATITDGKAYFDTVLYTGNGSTKSISGLEFSPDFVWIKNRAVSSTQHLWYDTIRGATNTLFSSSTSAEYSFSGLTSFDANGFTVGSQFPGNGAGNGIAAWTWNAGGTTVANTDGTITSQVRANTDSGFSIVSYTGNATSGATVGHGLATEPDMLIFKNRSGTDGWIVFHREVGGVDDWWDTRLLLSSAVARAGNAGYLTVAPTSTLLTLGSTTPVNGSGSAYIAYCFAEIDGFSKFGSYTGNGNASDGPFVYTGFRPAFVIMKSSTNGYYWVMKDSKRARTSNPATGNLYPNDLLLEDTTVTAYVDLLANGFKLRGNYLGTNGSGVGYIYMAFAENPFKTARAR